ncbi:MAG: SDR family NAD(P)-dependent oxidoreductase [Clostridiales bacterium]|nr:SDR family NAD(P)-dependent oxidoreductase [Clostridiales bacterium]
MIAIITGATGDIGEEFVKKLINEVDSVWAVGRNESKLAALKDTYGEKIVPVKADLSDKEDIFEFCRKIADSRPEIGYLVNNAGVARMAPVSEFTLEEMSDMLDINDKAATLICRACLPYMAKGSYILNIASASAFQPNPYIALYSASKAYLLSFTRSLNVENEAITCTAVCPGWVDTKMLPKSGRNGSIRYPGMVTAAKVVESALRDCHKGKDVSVCSFYYRYMRFLSKVTPHRVTMKMWVRAIRQYI